MTAIIPGQRIRGFEILSVDPTGKRVAVGCRCSAVHIFSVEALLSGSAICSAMSPTAEQIAALRDEATHRRRRREQRNCRPSGDRTP
jgi:hypothetical protein